jgi:hypothetical protein
MIGEGCLEGVRAHPEAAGVFVGMDQNIVGLAGLELDVVEGPRTLKVVAVSRDDAKGVVVDGELERVEAGGADQAEAVRLVMLDLHDFRGFGYRVEGFAC